MTEMELRSAFASMPQVLEDHPAVSYWARDKRDRWSVDYVIKKLRGKA